MQSSRPHVPSCIGREYEASACEAVGSSPMNVSGHTPRGWEELTERVVFDLGMLRCVIRRGGDVIAVSLLAREAEKGAQCGRCAGRARRGQRGLTRGRKGRGEGGSARGNSSAHQAALKYSQCRLWAPRAGRKLLWLS